MIGTISIECNAKNPNMPLHPLRAYINSPSSLRITNVPRKIGKWNINKVTIVAIYPDSTSQTAECVLTGGVWVGTIEGSTTAGTLTQGYSIIADGVDENGNDVTGYVLGKGDVEIMQSSSTPEPEPSTIFVRLQDDGTGAEDGDMYPTESGYMIQQNGEAHQLGTPFEQITSYVDSAISSKADLSTLDDYAKIEDLSSKADLSAIPTNISQLSNDSGYITSADIITKRDISDMRVKGVPQNANTQSWFTIKYGTTTENAWYYDEGRWESGVTTRVYATSTSQVFELQRLIESQWTSLGTFSLDSNFEATVTYDSVTYSITGYVGDIVASSELPTKTSDLSNDSGFITSADIITKRGLYDMDVYAEDVLSAGYYAVSAYDHATGDFAMSAVLKRQSSLTWWVWQSGISSSMSLQNTSTGWQFTYQNIDNGHGTTYTGSIVNVQVVDPLQTAEFSDNQLDFKLNTAASQLVNSMQLSKVEDKIWYDNTSVANSQNVVHLEDRTVQAVSLASNSTVMVLPALKNGKTNDFVLDVVNDAGETATFSLSGTIGIDFNILVPEGESFAEMTTVQVGEIAEYYLTKTAFQLSSLPTWKVVKQKVETYIPETI